MSTRFEDIEKEARRHPADERARLADVSAAWDTEIAQRFAAPDRGDVTTH